MDKVQTERSGSFCRSFNMCKSPWVDTYFIPQQGAPAANLTRVLGRVGRWAVTTVSFTSALWMSHLQGPHSPTLSVTA